MDSLFYFLISLSFLPSLKFFSIASWADKVKYQIKYRFTSRMHYFAPPRDSPPNHCSAIYIPGRVDVLNAIHNYTNRLDPKNDLNLWSRAEALKFFVNFNRDLNQPLHGKY